MPKSATTRRRYGSTSLFTQDTITDPAMNTTKHVPADEVRNTVGDQGAEKLKAARKTKSQKDDIVSSSDEQETPAARRLRQKKAMDAENEELVGRVKSAMSKRGGPLVQGNYD